MRSDRPSRGGDTTRAEIEPPVIRGPIVSMVTPNRRTCAVPSGAIDGAVYVTPPARPTSWIA